VPVPKDLAKLSRALEIIEGMEPVNHLAETTIKPFAFVDLFFTFLKMLSLPASSSSIRQ
jgi:hypothetical protein